MRGAVHPVGEHRDEVHLGGPGGEEGVEHVGVAIPQRVAKSGEERVGVTHLGRSAAVPLERPMGVGRKRRGVALDERDRVTGARQGERAAEPSHTGPDDDNVGHLPPPASS